MSPVRGTGGLPDLAGRLEEKFEVLIYLSAA